MQRMLNRILRTEVRLAMRPVVAHFSESTKKVHQELYLHQHSKDNLVNLVDINQKVHDKWNKWTSASEKARDELYLKYIRECYGDKLSKAIEIKILNKLEFNHKIIWTYNIIKEKLPELSDKQIFHEMIATNTRNLSVFCSIILKHSKILSNSDIALLYKHKNTFDWEHLYFLSNLNNTKQTWISIKEILLSNKIPHLAALSQLRENFTNDQALYIIANLNSDELRDFQAICNHSLNDSNKIYLLETLIEDPHLIAPLKDHFIKNQMNLTVAISLVKGMQHEEIEQVVHLNRP